MKRMERLKREARESAESRGHRMAWFESSARRLYAVAACLDCDAYVQVTPSPLPNEIEIGGEAVAVDCGARKEEQHMETWHTAPIADTDAIVEVRDENGLLVGTVITKDATLIAAAPDLLAALQRFANYCEQNSAPELQGIACDAFAAIAKATGGAS